MPLMMVIVMRLWASINATRQMDYITYRETRRRNVICSSCAINERDSFLLCRYFELALCARNCIRSTRVSERITRETKREKKFTRRGNKIALQKSTDCGCTYEYCTSSRAYVYHRFDLLRDFNVQKYYMHNMQ